MFIRMENGAHEIQTRISLLSAGMAIYISVVRQYPTMTMGGMKRAKAINFQHSLSLSTPEDCLAIKDDNVRAWKLIV